MNERTKEHTRRIEYQQTLRQAYAAACLALHDAALHGRRTGCLEVAVQALAGALRNVEMEDRDAGML